MTLPRIELTVSTETLDKFPGYVLLALSSHAAASATCLSALEEVSRDADEGVVEAGWSPGLDHPLVERTNTEHGCVVLHPKES